MLMSLSRFFGLKALLVLAILMLCLVAAGIADARCGGGSVRGGRVGFFAHRRATRQGGCGGGASMSYRETHSVQMRGGGFSFTPRGMGTCGPGGCN